MENVSLQAELYKKINKMRLALSKDMNKSGANDYSHFSYFQLKDFMPRALALCDEYNVFTKFQTETRRKIERTETTIDYMATQETGEVAGRTETTKSNDEYALYGVLYVTDLDTGYTEIFIKEAKDATVSGATAIQNVGATSTYMKRYMYMDLFEINENDLVDAAPNGEQQEEVKEPKKTTSRFTKPTKTNAPKPVELPKAPEPTKTEITEAPVTPEVRTEPVVNADELMSIETKLYIANYAKLKGLDQREAIIKVAKQLNTDVPFLKESQKDIIISMIDEMEK